MSVVISQVYGGGGNTGAPYQNDFIELFNRGNVPVSLAGWSVQYASTTGSTWSKTDLTAVILAPGQYYLVKESGGTNGVPLPTADMTGTISMSATAGKVALVNNNTTITSGTMSLWRNHYRFCWLRYRHELFRRRIIRTDVEQHHREFSRRKWLHRNR